MTAEDVKFTIEAIMDPENGSENAPNYEDIQEIKVIDDHTIAFKLDAPNVAFLDYMTMAGHKIYATKGVYHSLKCYSDPEPAYHIYIPRSGAPPSGYL